MLKKNKENFYVLAEHISLLGDVRMTEEHLSKFWSITVDTLRRWRQNGTGPAYIKVGGRVLYRPEDIKEYERQRRYKSSGEKLKG
jgi:DNA-binding transcriptional MerR regulator